MFIDSVCSKHEMIHMKFIKLYQKQIEKSNKGDENVSTYIHFTEEQKEQARQTDLVELLCSQGEKLKPSGHEYEWRDGSAKVTV